MKRKLLFSAAVLSLSALSGCGGSGGDVAANPPGGAPVTNVNVRGPISGFGSIIVNGVRYDTSSATFTIDGQPGTQSDLAVGHIVTIAAEVGNGVARASSVDFDDNVEGPITSIDAAAGTFVVLGQTVRVDADTSFDDDISPRSLDGLAVGDVVEVSGFVDANGDIVATRIEREAPGGELEITGIISNVDTANMTFQIGALVVDYSAAMLEDFDGGEPADGDLVEVKGMDLGPGGELIATRVERKDDGMPGDEDDEVEVEGFITRFVSATDFDVAGQPVTTNAQTRFEGGTAADLALNVKVEVEGSLDADGVLVAEEVSFRRGGVVRIAALVEAVDPGAGTVTLLGITVTVDSMTRIEDKSDADVEPFGLLDIAVGDYLEVRGFEEPAGSGGVTATRLERDDAEDTVELRGFVEEVAEPNFVILGVTIVTDGATQFEDDDSPIGAAEFFARAAGQLVEAEGVLAGDSLVADEVEFEDD